jgi:hypothetical protein
MTTVILSAGSRDKITTRWRAPRLLTLFQAFRGQQLNSHAVNLSYYISVAAIDGERLIKATGYGYN